jgi:hypothetical protein
MRKETQPSSASILYSPTLAIADLSCKSDRASKRHLNDKGKQVEQRKQVSNEAESRS